ncbi:MAG: hypothetical protein ABW364_16895 [Rhodococcus fascians]
MTARVVPFDRSIPNAIIGTESRAISLETEQTEQPQGLIDHCESTTAFGKHRRTDRYEIIPRISGTAGQRADRGSWGRGLRGAIDVRPFDSGDKTSV